jgi:gliding motility-associated lipoprotein GldD
MNPEKAIRVPYNAHAAAFLVRALLAALILGPAFQLSSCNRGHTPLPSGHVRIKTPEKAYRLYDAQPQYSFEIPVYARVERDSSRGFQPGWINIVFPQFNGSIHLSYKPVDGNLGQYIADCRTLAYKHTVKAEEIDETPFIQREQKRYGMIYDLKGNVASEVQFFITDSTTHFLRGSLYFNCPPNQDSLKPVVDFIREDIIHLIETTKWKVP